jgi:ParB/RepB/Spo0J family partition protein
MGKLEDRLKRKTEDLARPGTVSDEAQAAAGAAPLPGEPTSAHVTPIRSQPTTMPGQLGAFRNEALKYTKQIAERDQIIDDLKNSTDRVQRIDLALITDSPYQPRLEYDPAEIDALAKTMAASRQADPIKVRKVGGRYELISGHRRKRAALSIGWTELDALVQVRDDKEAELESMLLVVGNVTLSDYEFAKMYRRALDKKFCKSQEDVAKMFGVSQPKVSMCLEMLALPAQFTGMLDAKPSLFTALCGRVVKELLKEHPGHEEIIVRGVRRMIEEGASQASLKGWVNQTIAQEVRNKKPVADVRTVTREGRSVFTMKRTGKAVTVNFKAKDIDEAKFEKDLHTWLKAYANTPAEDDKK